MAWRTPAQRQADRAGTRIGDWINDWVGAAESLGNLGENPPEVNPPDTGPNSYEDYVRLLKIAQDRAAQQIDPLQARIEGLYGEDGTISFPGFTEWLQQQQGMGDQASWQDTSGLEGLQRGLLGELGDLDPNSEEARAFAAEMAGFDSWEERQEFMDSLLEVVGAQEGAGMSEEDMALQQQSIRRNTADMERRAERMIADSYSESGAMGRMMMQADEALNQIQDAQIQQQAQLAADNRDLKFQQYQEAKAGYEQQFQQGSISATDYVNTRRLALGEAVTGYATEMQRITEMNEFAYESDYNALVESVSMTIAAVQMELGLILAEYEAAAQEAAMSIWPKMTEMEMDALFQANNFGFDDIASLISDAAAIVTAIMGGQPLDINF